MRTLSRETALTMAGVTVCLLLVYLALTVGGDLVAGVLAPAQPGTAGSPGAPSAGPGLVTIALLTIAAVVAALLLPPAALLAAAVVMAHGLGTSALQGPLVGPLLISDMLLLVYLLRGLARRRTDRAAPTRRSIGLYLVSFLAWSALATVCAGASVTPLLRIAVYGAVFLLLARRGMERGLIYGIVLGYALVSVVGGALQGQTRLVGLDIGDPAQTGALLLAALCPLLTSELRFPGRWLAGTVLIYGLFLTQTRSVWFATVVVLVVWAQRKLSLARLTAIFLALGVVGLKTVDWVTLQFGLNQASADYRLHSISNGIRNGLDNPVFGSGWGNVPSMAHFRENVGATAYDVMPYNLFVSVFTFVGLPGVLLLTLALGGLLRHLVAGRGAPLLFATAVLAMSLTEMTLYAGSMLTLLFFIYAGLGLGPAGGDRVPAAARPAGAGRRAARSRAHPDVASR